MEKDTIRSHTDSRIDKQALEHTRHTHAGGLQRDSADSGPCTRVSAAGGQNVTH